MLITLFNKIFLKFGYQITKDNNSNQHSEPNILHQVKINYSKIAKELSCSHTHVKNILAGKYKNDALLNRIKALEIEQIEEAQKENSPEYSYEPQNINLLNIEFDPKLVNVFVISKASGFSYTYTREIVYGLKSNVKASRKIRNTIIKLYGSIIKYNQLEKAA